MIYSFVTKTLTYDDDLAKNVKSGYLPNVDAVLEKKKGICFDYAALMSSMLRLQGIPSKLVVGNAGEVYHAWINIYSEEQGSWIENVIHFDGTNWYLMDPTFVSTSNAANAVKLVVKSGQAYTKKYVY